MNPKCVFTLRTFLPYLLLYWIAFQIEIQLTAATFPVKSCDPSTPLHCNDTVSQLFWQSIHQIEADTDAKFRAIAQRIATLELNPPACYQAIETTFRRGATDEWASKLIHSNSFLRESPVSSLHSETFTSLGDFETCLSVSDVSTEIQNATVTFSGRYCLLSMGTPSIDAHHPKERSQRGVSPSTFKLATKWLSVGNRFPLVQGICFPSICSEEELVSLIHQYFPRYFQGINLTIGYCQQPEARVPFSGDHLTGSQVIALVILSFFTLLTTLGTALHWAIKVCHLPDDHQLSSIAGCFDLHRNVKFLFSLSSQTEPSNEPNLRFIHGLKVWFILLMVLVHSFAFLPNLLLSKVSLFSHYPSFYHQLLQQVGLLANLFERVFLLIDSFFIISGFLVTHRVIQHCRQVPNLAYFIFARWVRFAPSVLALLCLTIVLQALGSGPLFHQDLTDPYVAPCVNYWWTHLLFINNWYTLDQMCGANLWFVSADFQLSLLLYPVLLAYFTKKRYAHLVSFALISLSFGTLAFLVVFAILGIPRGDYPLHFASPAPLDAIRVFYTSPCLHTLAYLMGALVAFQFHQGKRTPPARTKYTDSLLLLGTLVVLFALLSPLPSGLLSPANENRNLLHFLLWTLLYLLILLPATYAFDLLLRTPKGSLVKRLFSAPFTQPLGRLSYGIYLVNPLLIWYNTQQSRQTVPLTGLYTLQFFSVIYMQSLLLSIYLYLFFEAPFSNLFRHLSNGIVEKQSKQVEDRLRLEAKKGNANELQMNRKL